MKITTYIVVLFVAALTMAFVHTYNQLEDVTAAYELTKTDLDMSASAYQDLEDELATTRETLSNLNNRFDKCNAYYEHSYRTRAKVLFAKLNPFDDETKVVEEFE